MTQKSIALNRAKREDTSFEVLSRDQIAGILGTLTRENAFFFHEDVGRPTGDSAESLIDFCSKINIVAAASLAFHLKREDFENWTRNAIGDTELANRITKVRKTKTAWKSEDALRKKLYAVVKDRVTELQELWRYALTWPESAPA